MYVHSVMQESQQHVPALTSVEYSPQSAVIGGRSSIVDPLIRNVRACSIKCLYSLTFMISSASSFMCPTSDSLLSIFGTVNGINYSPGRIARTIRQDVLPELLAKTYYQNYSPRRITFAVSPDTVLVKLVSNRVPILGSCRSLLVPPQGPWGFDTNSSYRKRYMEACKKVLNKGP
jgi:hypothetical protein